MSNHQCMIEACRQPVYAPAGTGYLCKEHFTDLVAWRRRKGGPAGFRKYSAMTQEERDPIIDEWRQTVKSPY